jgi:hypothetical protein
VQWKKKTGPKGHTLYGSTYIKYPEEANPERQTQVSYCLGLGGEEVE